jgi:hypothetical protein
MKMFNESVNYGYEDDKYSSDSDSEDTRFDEWILTPSVGNAGIIR